MILPAYQQICQPENPLDFEKNLVYTENYQPFDAQPLLFPEDMYYHNTNLPGFFALLSANGKGKRQSSFRLELLPQVLTLIDPTHDSYISQAEFFQPNRRVVNLWRISLNYVDIDFYTVPHLEKRSPEYVAGLILEYCEEEKIPLPSCIVSSGKGLYLKWFYKGAIPRAALPRWNELQRIFVDLFKGFGADSKAKDASRVLRLESTTNTKTGKVVSVLYPTRAEPHQYDFEELTTDLFPRNREEHRELQREYDKRRKAFRLIYGNNNTSGLHRFNATRLNWDRLEDIRKLARLRGGVHEGDRDMYLFLATCFAAWTLAPHSLNIEVQALGREFSPSYSRSQVASYATSAISRAVEAATGQFREHEGKTVDARYRFKNSTLIEWLEISATEQKQMQTIISVDEARARDRKRDETRRRQRGELDRSSYLAPVVQKRTEAKLRKANGESLRHIAEALEVSLGSVQNYLKD